MGLHVFFDVIKFLNKETSYIAWHPMFNIFSYMSTFLKFSVAEATKANFLDILNELLRNVGYEEDEGENEMTMPLRLLAIKWACELGHEKCRKAAAEKLFAYIYNSKQNIFARWTTWMFCTGMMDANKTLSNLIWQHGFEKGNMEILEHLTCIEDENILLHYLDLISIMRPNENNATKLSIEKLYRSIIKKHIGKKKVLNYFLNNYFEIIDRFPYNFYTHDNLTLLGDIFMNIHSDLILNKINIYVTKESFGNELYSKVRKLIKAKRELLLRQRRKFKAFYDDF
ncbi:uncharacterized protein LOC116851925 [Odontomachus brunneus]|uniref:uncharacterized protein LOC116851925 n=1 Tax=Odontomachus brunneus TaxID=486640 RepID=UPI0013F18EE2|nr:uncharacterized protein LOC116851925 [Odontomachus brunneus]